MDQCSCASAHKQKSNGGGPTLENDVSGRGKARRLDWDWDCGMSHKMMEEKWGDAGGGGPDLPSVWVGQAAKLSQFPTILKAQLPATFWLKPSEHSWRSWANPQHLPHFPVSSHFQNHGKWEKKRSADLFFFSFKSNLNHLSKFSHRNFQSSKKCPKRNSKLHLLRLNKEMPKFIAVKRRWRLRRRQRKCQKLLSEFLLLLISLFGHFSCTPIQDQTESWAYKYASGWW